MPAASAGLLRFFEEDTPGVKISPYLVVATGMGLIGVVLFLKALEFARILPPSI